MGDRSAGKDDSPVIGREPELALLAKFLRWRTDSLALLFTGGQGIGKTALWEEGLRLAAEQGIRVLAARPSGAEAELSFAGLYDLLEGVDIDALSTLPAPQRKALDTALLRAEPARTPPDRFAIAAGFLSVLRALAGGQRLLLAVDDLQWLDPASAEVLAFAARRARGQRFRFLLARRSGEVTGVENQLGPGGGLHRAEIGALSLAATRRLLALSLGLAVPPRTLRRLVDVTQGNPLLALELGRALAAGQTWAADAELPVPDLAGNPFGARVTALPRPARRALLATALSGHLSLPKLMAVADPAAVDELVAGRLLVRDGERVRLSHPLLAVAVRRQAGASERQALHLALAEVAEDATLRARHLALSAPGLDERVAGAVAAAAQAAACRGAAHDAAELAEHAFRLTPPRAAGYPAAVVLYAQCLVEVGELSRVLGLLRPRIGELPPGGLRGRAHLLLGEASSLRVHEEQLERALAESGEDPGLRAAALAKKARLLTLARVARIGEAEALAAQAHELACAAGGEEEPAARQSLAWARVLAGRPVDDLAAGPPPGDLGFYEGSAERPATVRLMLRGHIAQARARLRRLLALAGERGETLFGAVLTLHLCELELRAGDTRAASALLDEWAESGTTEGMEPNHARCRCLLAALRGDAGEVARWAAEARVPAPGEEIWDGWDELELLRAEGIAALAAHDPERAAGTLGRVWDHTLREGVDDPGAFPAAPDLTEALVWLGQAAAAQAVTSRLHGLAESQQHPWGLASALRCAAVTRLASGYDEHAGGQLAEAAGRYGELGLRFDRARTLLWLGREARRARKRTVARRALETAAGEFAALGASAWAGQAQEELGLLGARRAPAQGLTPAQRRVVELAATGMSNKEIARKLFVAVHTVEVHLGHAYAKLGVRSRAQLANRLASATPPGAPPPQPPPQPPQPSQGGD